MSTGHARRLAAVAAAALLPVSAAAALAQGITKPLVADLDGDGVAERLVVRTHRDKTGFRQRKIELRAECPDGSKLAVEVLRPRDAISELRTIEADGLEGQPEVLLEGRSGASGRASLTKLIRFDPPLDGVGCGEVRTLFRFDTTRPRPKPPRGYSTGSSYVRVRNYEPSRPGREIRLVESLLGRRDAGCCPRFERISMWGYSENRDKYVRLRSKIRRINRG
jgi:hypothetical protein